LESLFRHIFCKSFFENRGVFMKTGQKIFAFIITLTLLLSNVPAVNAQPPLPSSFYGTVKLGGANVPDGTVVTAWMNGVQYASTLTLTFGSDSVYSIDVRGDDPGGNQGTTVVFHIGAQVADQTGLWASGTNVSLNLSAPKYSLNISKTGSGSGTVTSVPAGIDCGSTCSANFTFNTSIDLSAAPVSGSTFTGWSGACTGTGTCTVTMNQARSVSAEFALTSIPTGLTCTNLASKPATASTGEKPQSKVWNYSGSWYAVFPTNTSGASSAGTWLWKLVGTTWTEVLKLSDRTDTKADVKVAGTIAHILLYADSNTQYSTVEFVSGNYQLWSTRPTLVNISLPGSEIATIDRDSTGRLWLATRNNNNTGEIVVYYSDTPYSTWNGPVVLATGVVANDDIAVVTAFPNGTVGVLWANETTKYFGFKVHVDGANPATWSADELPASQSFVPGIGLGMADDHMNVAVASDSTLYAAVKTSYDTAGYPKMSLLVRRPNGTWDNLYGVDEGGTRPIILLDEVHGILTYIYTHNQKGITRLFTGSPQRRRLASQVGRHCAARHSMMSRA
jgi:hypothetical protein